MSKVPSKMRSNKLWKDVYDLAEHVYEKINDLVVNFPEEKWTTANKLRISANDSLFYLSQAIGNIRAESSLYDWVNARKNLFSLQTIYIFAAKQKFFELEAEVIVSIDAVLKQVDQKIEQAERAVDTQNKQDLEPWLEKYRIWQKIQD